MTAYMIVDVEIHDVAAYEKYKREVPALITKHGGEYMVRGGEFEVLEGTWTPTRLVMFSFPSRDNIHAFLDDPDYADLKALRHSISTTNTVAVDGWDQA